MPIWIGSFGKAGSPVLQITVSGPFTNGLEYEAILDTGFTGFLSMPLLEAIRLGLVLHGTTKVSLADGSHNFRLTARGQIEVKGEKRIGVVILESSSTELLLGMAFLRQFGKVVLVSQYGVILQDEKELLRAIKAEEKAIEAGQSAVSSDPAASAPPYPESPAG